MRVIGDTSMPSSFACSSSRDGSVAIASTSAGLMTCLFDHAALDRQDARRAHEVADRLGERRRCPRTRRRAPSAFEQRLEPVDAHLVRRDAGQRVLGDLDLGAQRAQVAAQILQIARP